MHSQAAWISPDGKTENQIDHFGISKKFRRFLEDVRVMRGADTGTDHYLVGLLAKLRLKLKRHMKSSITSMSERPRLEDVKNIGDAGDSIPNCKEAFDSPVCEMVKCIKSALHCGDHQSLKVALEKLEIWKSDKDGDRIYDYWRVAQLTGETELKNICILLTVTSEKPDNVRWLYLQDALSVLAMSLCNREIISTMLFHIAEVQQILIEAVVQTYNEEVFYKSLAIINRMLLVCRERFAKSFVTSPFLDALIKGIDRWLGTSVKVITKIIQVLKSMLMCGQGYTFDNAADAIKKISHLFSHVDREILTSTDQDEIDKLSCAVEVFEELEKSIDLTVDECTTYWTKGRSTKDLLCLELDQPWLFIHCSWPPCGSHNIIPRIFFRKCSACSVVRYCSRQCQRKHWEAGHQVQCKAIINRNKSV
ncbi:craniofacial development protein 2 [Elysia marginata]|uniref:Craniofacial development protein 2 n=1 Tax=Elysia marginata TaxID=1093978 RepID=A0AAV4FFR5_9GAST|nr:craniofacial development protein 2 [Elysia marginata]